MAEIVSGWGNQHGIPNDFEIVTPGKAELLGINLPPGAATPIADAPSETDSLDRQHLVNALADMFTIMPNPKGMAVALLGDWGAGKSTVFALLKKALRERPKESSKDKQNTPVEFIFSEFNAWKYEQTSNIPAGLTEVVSRSLIDVGCGWQNRKKLRHYMTASKAERGPFRAFMASQWQCLIRSLWLPITLAWVQYRRTMAYSALPILAVIILCLIVLPFSLSHNLATGVGISFAALAFINFEKAHQFLGLINKTACIKSFMSLPSFNQHLGLIPIFHQHLETLCRQTLSRRRRLLLFVDDLDRCQPDYIANVFDAIRLVMDLENVIVLVGIDHRIAFKAMEKRYTSLADADRSPCEIARDYLSKIIQLPIRLLPPSGEELDQFIDQKLFGGVGRKTYEQSDSKEEENLQPKADATTTINTATRKTAEGTEQPPSNSSTGVATPPVEPPPPPSPEAANKAMEDSPRDHDLFAKLAQAFEFNNPRQLLRLHNANRLLKALALRGLKKNQFDRALLRMIFWQEFLHTMPRAARHRCMAALADPEYLKNDAAWERALNSRDRDEPASVPDLTRAKLRQIRATLERALEPHARELFESGGLGLVYAKLARWTRCAVLPHCEDGVLDTPEEINDWRAAEEKEAANAAGQTAAPPPGGAD